MKTIAVGHVKGGVGKSTTAVQLALHAGAAGHRTLLLDADPGRTTQSWAARAPDWPHDRVPVFAHHRPDLPRRLPGLAHGYDLVVIDTPHDPAGGVQAGEMLVSAIAVADLLVVPTSPAPADLDRLTDLLAAIAREQSRRDLDWLIALTRVDLRSRAAATEVVDAMFTRQLPVLALTTRVEDPPVMTATWVPERNAVRRAFGSARVLVEYSGLATAVLARALGQTVEATA
jgi:chromosome partitioning protein